jgi:hypothetical protein
MTTAHYCISYIHLLSRLIVNIMLDKRTQTRKRGLIVYKNGCFLGLVRVPFFFCLLGINKSLTDFSLLKIKISLKGIISHSAKIEKKYDW